MEMNTKLSKSQMICRSLLTLLAALVLIASASVIRGQKAADNTPKGGTTPAAASTAPATKTPEKTYNGYRITFTGEAGWRFRAFEGNENQYRSNLNYEPGFRTFDSSLFVRNDEGKGKYFDSLLVSNSGWGSDPNGYTRVNMEKTGYYKVNSSLRRIDYFNNLSTFTAVADPNQHTQDVRNTMGDFDLTIFPQNDLLRLNFGTSFGKYEGPGTWTMRWNSDEFKVDTDNDNRWNDYRVGAEGKLIGFDWNVTQGFRFYKDRTSFAITGLNQGHNATNTTAVNSFSRRYPIDGRSSFTQFNLHRNFGEKVDFTGRVIYSNTKTVTSLTELVSGRDASNNFIDADNYQAQGNSKRPQTRADFGVTYLATDAFRISNTFTFDQFSIGSGESFYQNATRRSPTGAALSPTLSSSTAWRSEAYRRYTNILEGDYQFNKRLSAHVGWRYTQRRSFTDGYDASYNFTTNIWTITSIHTPAGPENTENSTNTLVAGMKIKPIKGWTLWWDVEHGAADNVFTRLENYQFTNWRLRSKYVKNKFSFDVAVITKNNENPEFSYPPGSTITPTFGFTPITTIKSRFYSGSVTWDPEDRVSLSGGYTYRDQDTFTPVIFPYGLCLNTACSGTGGTSTVFNAGYSQFFMHDHYGYIEAAVNPVNRVSVFAAFRMNKDTGQDDVTSPLINGGTFGLNPKPSAGGLPVYANVIGGYPMSLMNPEVRIAFRLTDNIDWNVGYQYYRYNDVLNPNLNYRAQLPFTSLRFYFGGGVADRWRR